MRASKYLVAAALVSVVVLPACSRIKTNQGYVIDESLVTAIQPGVDNRTSVEKTLGRPTFVSEFGGLDWYYVSRATSQLAFAAPKPTSQSVIKVTFDAKGNVASVNRRGLEQVANISPTKDKTPTLGRDAGFFSDLFGNLGAVGAGTAPGGDTTGRDGPR